MKFKAEHITELVPLRKHLESGCTIIKSVRRANYLIHESPDRSAIELNALIQVGGHWYVWPRALHEYVEHQIQKTHKAYAA